MKVILVSKNLSKTSNLGIGPPYTTNSQKFFLHLWERGKKFLFWIAETQCVYLLSCWGEEGKGLGFTIFHHIQDTIKCVNPTIILCSIKNERKKIFFQLSYVTWLIIWLHLGFLGHKSEKCLSWNQWPIIVPAQPFPLRWMGHLSTIHLMPSFPLNLLLPHSFRPVTKSCLFHSSCHLSHYLSPGPLHQPPPQPAHLTPPIHYSLCREVILSRPCLKISTAWFTHRVRSVSLGFQRFMTWLLPAALVFWHFLQMKLLAASSKYTICFFRPPGLCISCFLCLDYSSSVSSLLNM